MADTLRVGGKDHVAKHFYDKAGKGYNLFAIGVLAAALGKTSQTIENWEKKKILPKPRFKVVASHVGHCRHWYSKEQIPNLQRTLQLNPFGTAAGKKEKKRFRKVVLQVFFLDRPASTNELKPHFHLASTYAPKSKKTIIVREKPTNASQVPESRRSNLRHHQNNLKVGSRNR